MEQIAEPRPPEPPNEVALIGAILIMALAGLAYFGGVNLANISLW